MCQSCPQIQRVLHHLPVLPADLLNDVHVREGGGGALGESEHRGVYPASTGEHQIQEKGEFLLLQTNSAIQLIMIE